MEFESVREGLEVLCEAAMSKNMTVDGKPATVEDFKEYILEIASGLCDLMGMEEIYLEG